MTAAQAKRVAKILRGLADSLPWIGSYNNAFKVECHDLARVLDRYAEWKQVAETPLPVDGGWTE